MNIKIFKLTIFALTLFIVLQIFFPVAAAAQRRDYLTAEEIELVRDNQEIDKRIEVLVKAIDRRFLVINQDTSPEKQNTKDSDKWGALPTGDRSQLLSDIRFLLQKAIDDIDDVAAKQGLNQKVLERDTTNDQDQNTAWLIKNNNKKFPQAVHYLAEASARYIPLLKAIGDKTEDRFERGSIIKAIESCQMVIEASTQVTKPQKKK